MRGGGAGMIFQEPMTALSPVHKVGEQVAEALRIHRDMGRREAWSAAVEMLGRVGIPDPAGRAQQYPFEFSGGMRQRVVIAMALVCRPRVLIADEPTTALDVTVQAQILELIEDLKTETGASVLFITHDLGVVAQVADEVAVMRRGRVVEAGPTRDIYRRPLHPYTRQLLGSVPGVPRLRDRRRRPVRSDCRRATSRSRSRAIRSTALLDIGGGRKLLATEDAGSRARPDRVHAVAPPIQPKAGGAVDETGDLLLRVRHLTKLFPVKSAKRRTLRQAVTQARAHGPGALLRVPRDFFAAVNDVSLDVRRGETLGLVGESGSGKNDRRPVHPCGRWTRRAGRASSSTPADGGRGVDLATLPHRALKPLRRRMQMIFQDPYASLNPRMTVGDIVAEPLLVHGVGSPAERRRTVAEMLERVGLPAASMSRYPHAFSGGQRQRVGIARALVLRPPRWSWPTRRSAPLDVSVRGRVLALLKELQAEMGLTYLFVAHDLSMVKDFCDRVAVMASRPARRGGAGGGGAGAARGTRTREACSAPCRCPTPDRPLRPESIDGFVGGGACPAARHAGGVSIRITPSAAPPRGTARTPAARPRRTASPRRASAGPSARTRAPAPRRCAA